MSVYLKHQNVCTHLHTLFLNTLTQAKEEEKEGREEREAQKNTGRVPGKRSFTMVSREICETYSFFLLFFFSQNDES